MRLMTLMQEALPRDPLSGLNSQGKTHKTKSAILAWASPSILLLEASNFVVLSREIGP